MFRLSSALKTKGAKAEDDFRAWLNRSGVGYLYIEQSPLTVPEGLRGRIKRPDYLVGIPHAGLLAFDVKAKTAYDGELLFDVEEIEKLALFARAFHLTVYFACLDAEGDGRQWWVPLAELHNRAPVWRGKRPVIPFAIAEAFVITPEDDFLRVVLGLSAEALKKQI
ncbi:hypothetical protein [Ensifer soli]|uniref:hypothetical protein n=1 Tax=Ciceribacter sp. sgz301302 TaxID=3342379 RepID=UPI0035B9279B